MITKFIIIFKKTFYKKNIKKNIKILFPIVIKKIKKCEKENSNITSPSSKSSGTYGRTVEQLEELMSAYKERGNEYLDIKQIENFRRNRFNN